MWLQVPDIMTPDICQSQTQYRLLCIYLNLNRKMLAENFNLKLQIQLGIEEYRVPGERAYLQDLAAKDIAALNRKGVSLSCQNTGSRSISAYLQVWYCVQLTED